MKKLKYRVGDLIITNCGKVREIIKISDIKNNQYPYYLKFLKEDDCNEWCCGEDYIRPAPKICRAM